MKLDSLGWNSRHDNLFERYRSRSLIAARVVADGRDPVTVASEEHQFSAVTAGSLDGAGEPGPPVIGDWVAVDLACGTPVIRAVLPRSGVLARRRPGAAERVQVVAANVDTVLLVDGLDRGPNRRRIERGVALAYDSGATPVIVLTKADLCPDVVGAEEEAKGAAPFADVLALSAVDGSGVDALAAMLETGSTAVLFGPSGAGKSTLINSLLGEARLETRDVRKTDRKGRHTTTRRQLVTLAGGACLIDTPGIRELGLWLDAEAVDSAYADLEELAAGCRFRDCRHENEPGCAVRAAVRDGRLEQGRLDGYLRLRREAEAHELRRATHQIRASERRFSKMVRDVKRIKGG